MLPRGPRTDQEVPFLSQGYTLAAKMATGDVFEIGILHIVICLDFFVICGVNTGLHILVAL